MRVGRCRPFSVCLVLAIGAGLLVHQPVVQARDQPSPADQAAARQAMQRAAAVMETATGRAQAATAAFVETSQRLPGAQTRVASAQGRVAAAAVRSAAAERASARAAAELRRAQQHFAAAQAAVEQARDTLGTFVRATYEGHSAMVLSALSAAEGPQDLLERIDFATQLIGRQGRAVDQVERRRQVVAEERALVAQHKLQVDAARAAARRALATARAEQSAARAAQAVVVSLVSRRRNAVAVANQEKSASQERYAEAQAESNRIGRALRAAAHRERRGSTRTRTRGYRPRMSRPGQLWMPVAGWKSSDFGYRFDPYFRRWQLHAGTDFAAASGTPIHAAAGGVVVRAGWNGGYGNYTCVYHGGDLSTCYGHQSRILVWAGEEVSRGETIGLVGTTGASTGSHLHFEVRIDGDPVNPLGYL
ncbi:M23 family metallopeptidase [Cryptosporangium sp. NPDC051539]|uniref:M23 family metallopeptidase n=1 Tax=Cryptosporangium sp. NPDC051539 TaxID=3363962 RepID=UPI0037BA55CC